VLDRDELVAEFDLDRVTHSAAFFDYKKLDWLNGEYIRALSLERLTELVEEFAVAAFGTAIDATTAAAVARIGQERAVTIAGLVEQAEFLVVADDVFAIEPTTWDETVAKTERPGDVLDAAIAHLEACEWTLDGVDVRPALEAIGIEKTRKVMPLLYVAVEARRAGLPLFDGMYLLGRERTLARLRAARARIGSAGGDDGG
jgi:glutamyl-tRNA synthetase